MTQTDGSVNQADSAASPEPPLSTSRTPPPSMRRAARAGARLGLISGTLQQLLSVVATIVLVRILSAAQIGLASLATLIVGFASLFTAAGFGQIIVKRESISERVTSTVFWTATVFGAFVAAVIGLAAIPLAAFSGHREAAGLVVILAPTVLFSLMASVPRGLLQRQMRFGRLYAADLVAMVVYVIVQITLAVGGAGAYAVVFGQLASSAVAFAVSAAGARWRPHLMLDRSVIRDERRFGGGTLANTLGTFIVKNADNWVVSRTSSASQLGVYYVAYVLPNILRQRLTWMATDVLMPVFARLVADLERSRRAYREALGLHVFIGFPAMAGISALAPRIVAVCFGPKWTGVAAPLRLLALAALVEFVTQAATTVFIAHGIPGRNAVIKVYALVVLLAGLAITYRHGLVPVAGAVVVASTVGAVVSQVLICRLLKLRIREVAVSILPVALATAIMVGVILLVDRTLGSWPDVPALAVLIAIGGVSYLASGRLLAPATSRALLREALAIVIPRRRQRVKARS